MGTQRAFSNTVRSHFLLTLVVGAACMPARGATLEKLSLDDMILKSTAIVRGTVSGSAAAARGPVIYTHYAVQVTERYKGSAPEGQDVAVPGGSANGFRQSFPGSPELTAGSEYVFFLWTGPSGITQIIGLTQGLFTLTGTASGTTITRPPSPEEVLDPATGQQVKDQSISIRLSDLKARIASALRGGTR